MTTAYRRRTTLKGERGYVLVMSALLMLPLLAFAGFAVDVGSWYLYANRMQRAADAAALAGVVWMPNDEKAEQIALDTAKANGFDDAASDIVVTVTPVGNRRLQVNITDTSVNMYFSKIFIDSVDIQRQALAEYVQAIPMGSPDNTMGNDPDRWNSPGYNRPYYWLNVSGPRAAKHNGDRFTSGSCELGSSGTAASSMVSGCSATNSSGVNGGHNVDYSQNGYFYQLTVDQRPATGDLSIEIFDPAFTHVTTTCVGTNLPEAGTTWTNEATKLRNGDYGAWPFPTDTADSVRARYQRDSSSSYTTNPYCIMDTGSASNGGFGAFDVETTYLLRAPDNTPFDNTDNPVICARTFGDFNSSVLTLLQSTTNRSPEGIPFRNHFRRWWQLCSIPRSSVVIGDYYLQVTSTADQSNAPTTLPNYSSSVNTGGYNMYSLRAGWGSASSAGYSTGVSFFADGRLPTVTVQSGAGVATNFYLARIVPEYAGQMLELELFDVGDGPSGASADLTIIPPADLTGDAINNCTFIRDNNPVQTFTPGGCTLTSMTSASYNGRLLTVQVPLPDNYNCNAGDQLGCWFKIRLDYGSTLPTDLTTWSARVRGDPVRIVE